MQDLEGDRGAWHLTMDYTQDVPLFRDAPINDGSLRFSSVGAGERRPHLELVA